jgi:hypothetical protein
LLALIIILAFSYGCGVQKSTLVVTLYLGLTVESNSSSIPGIGQILELNTSVSVIKWPQTAIENVYVNPVPTYTFNETRTTPVHFAVSVYLDKTNKTVLTPDNLTTTGDYSAEVTSIILDVNQGTHNLTMAVYVPMYENYTNRVTWFVTIP